MSSPPATVAIPRIAPFQREPAVGQVVAVAILLAGAAVMVTWAVSAPAAFPRSPAPCARPGAVTSAQDDIGAVRIRFAESASDACAPSGPRRRI